MTSKKLSDLLEMMGVGAPSPQGADESESIPKAAVLTAVAGLAALAALTAVVAVAVTSVVMAVMPE